MEAAASPTTAIVPGFTFRMLEDDSVAVFTLVGKMPLAHVGRALYLGTEAIFRRDCHVVVDFSRAAEVHESGIGILHYAKAFIQKRGRRFALIAPEDPAVFRRLPVDMPSVFSVHPDLDDAVRAVSS